jgi:predicted nucleic acid-binding Zn ribbon protein
MAELDQRRRRARRTALIVALVALIVYVAFLSMGIGLSGLQKLFG